MADTNGAVSAWEAAVAASANKVTSVGGGAAVVGSVLSSSNFIGYAGLAIALAGFIVNWIYKRKHFKLAEKRAQQDAAVRGFYDEG